MLISAAICIQLARTIQDNLGWDHAKNELEVLKINLTICFRDTGLFSRSVSHLVDVSHQGSHMVAINRYM